jgi:UDP-glucose 4-epimerase
LIALPKGIDTIVHLAALNEIDSANAGAALTINVQGTLQLIEAAAIQGVKNFVYASTIHVYGPLVGTLQETSCLHSQHPYGFTHHMAEQLLEYAAGKYGISATCLRFSNVIGAPANMSVNRWTLLVNDLCKQAVETKKMVLKSPESQRDFVAMPDVCAAIERAMGIDQKEVGFDVINISSGKSMRVIEMAQLIALHASRILNCKIEITCESCQTAAPPEFRIDNSKALAWGWRPESNLVGEIEATLRLCVENEKNREKFS